MNELRLSQPSPQSLSPMTSSIAAEFVTAVATGGVDSFKTKYGIGVGNTGANWIAIAKLICAVADVICPIVGNL